ncbi:MULTISPECIES: hypothetical protein [unclassified Streptomyces]|uniref:hypothetical protein n=1 Tax=unclassified Streptomyces TaxID=2593676 RepID=UPI00081EA866|nr:MULTISPECIES: hypothetical protein [unclassified Streptomyces]MYR93063.1 hypothetical protein [Streptomyces sp. SID4937]SCD45827.1 hypothetical protein GA0115243_102141 [Streptomyces sp. ScaeMP-e83]
MTEEEAVQIAEYVAAACPAQKFGEFTPDVWGEILKPYAVDEARTAVIAVARRQPWISPAEIVDEIKARREERIELAHVVYDGNPDETGAQSAASHRALIRAAADGQLPARTPSAALGTADRLALPPGEPGPYTNRVAAVRAAVGQATPTAREGVVNPRAIPCRACQALPGNSCTVRGRRMRDVHPARLDDARRRAAGLPPLDPDEARAAEDRIRAASAAALAQHDATEEPS